MTIETKFDIGREVFWHNDDLSQLNRGKVRIVVARMGTICSTIDYNVIPANGDDVDRCLGIQKNENSLAGSPSELAVVLKGRAEHFLAAAKFMDDYAEEERLRTRHAGADELLNPKP